MIPPRLRTWILIWTPIAWLVGELATFPKDRPVTSGFGRVIGGFFDKSVASYPAWVMLVLAVVVAAVLRACAMPTLHPSCAPPYPASPPTRDHGRTPT